MSKRNKNRYRLRRNELQERGWTDALIDSLLPEPKMLQNKAGKWTPTWWNTDVEEAEKNKAFQQRKRKFDEVKLKKENEKQKKIDYIKETSFVSNPADNYPFARELKRHFIINVGATNTGKTYTALQALKKANDGVYLAPLRLLAMEVQDTLNTEGYLCSMSTGEEEDIVEGATIMSSTVEKIDVRQYYKVGIIDECQMIADKFRGGSWTKAILGLAAETIYLCMSPDALEICIKLIVLCGDTYEIVECERKTPLIFEKKQVKINDLTTGDAIILFSRKAVLNYATELEKKGLKVSVVYGALPYQSRKKQVEMYRNGETDIVVSTDAIGMGLNLPIRRIIFVEDSKFDGEMVRKLNQQEIKQIAGRAGRYGIYDKGYVSTFVHGNAYPPYVRSELLKEPKQIKIAHIPFPEECINETIKISESLKLWKEIEYPDIFVHEDVEELLKRIKYLEKQYPKLERQIMYKLASVIFDEGSEFLFDEWKYYVKKYLDGGKIVLPYIVGDTLADFELVYKQLDLYYSFHKIMNIEFNEDALQEAKYETIGYINKKLLEERKNAQVKTCRKCGKVLPPFFKFNICEACFHGQHYGYFDNGDEEEIYF